MITNCKQINLALNIAEASGNHISEIVEGGWSKMKVVIYMQENLSADLKNLIQKRVTGLRYRKFEGSLYYPADEGFICDKHSIAISFPIKKNGY